MFRRSRLRIILLVMGSAVLLIASMFVVIYASSYAEIEEQNKSMLRSYVDSFSLSGRDGKDNKPAADRPPEKKRTEDIPRGAAAPRDDDGAFRKQMYQHTDFYSVVYDENGNVLQVDTSQSQLLSEAEVIEIAAGLTQDGYGKSGNLIYMNVKREGYNLTVFMDNSILTSNMGTLLKNTLLYGSICIVIIAAVSFILSRRIVAPLEDSYTKQKQFISDAGHELKTPVSVISANAELLSRELDGENVWLSNIVYENEKMSVLITQLLELSRTERVEQQFEQIDMSRTVMGEILPFESVAFEKSITLNSDIDDNIEISGSSSGIAQLTAILLDNAVSHCSEGGEITLTLKEKRRSAVMTVTNDGEPIAPEHIDRIFDRFYRIDKVRGDDSHYGLGLSIAKAIVASHKGRIDVRCYDGKVEFAVHIPVSQKG